MGLRRSAPRAARAAGRRGQSRWIDDPVHDIAAYLVLVDRDRRTRPSSIIGTEAVRRSRRIHDGLADDMLHAAAEQFLPAAIAGMLLTFVLVRTAEAQIWMLPGLWQILFSLGVFASCRSLPRPMIAVAVWYLACRSRLPRMGDRRPCAVAVGDGPAVPGRTGARSAPAEAKLRRRRWRRLAPNPPADLPMMASIA